MHLVPVEAKKTFVREHHLEVGIAAVEKGAVAETVEDINMDQAAFADFHIDLDTASRPMSGPCTVEGGMKKGKKREVRIVRLASYLVAQAFAFLASLAFLALYTC